MQENLMNDNISMMQMISTIVDFFFKYQNM